MKIKRIISGVLAIGLVLMAFTGCSNDKNVSSTESQAVGQKPVEILISAGAGMTEALTDIAKEYKKVASNVTITYNFAASGDLQTQIEQGAPADIFVSASPKQLDALEKEDLIISDTRKNILKNKIVLIVPKDSTKDIKSFEDCATDKVSIIAIGNPESVPVGQYSEETFTYLNIWDKVSKKANFGASVKEVLAWVESGNVDCGVVYSTDAKISGKVKSVCEAPSGSHMDIIYPAAVVKSSKNVDAAKAFIDYLFSDEAVKVFDEYGFSVLK